MERWIEKFTKLNSYIPGVLPWSFSKLQLGIQCPGKFKWQYLSKPEDRDQDHALKVMHGIPSKVPDTTGKVIGQFLHTVLEECVLKGRMYGWSKEVINFDLVWHQTQERKRMTLREYNIAQEHRSTTEALLGKLIATSAKRRLDLLPEANFCMTLDGRMQGGVRQDNRMVSGKIDLMASNESTGECVIIDYKSYREGAYDESENVISQLGFYAYYIMKWHMWVQEAKLVGAYIPTGTIKPYKTITNGTFGEIEDRVDALYRANYEIIITGRFPFTKNDFCKFCELEGRCRPVK
jgi:hypothetical protein